MQMFIRLLSALPAVVWTSVAAASEIKVIINLSEQRAYLVEHGRVTLVSPIASGKPGWWWWTPDGNFSIFNKDIDHRSRSFGSVIDAYGRVVNSNATPTSRIPRGGHYRPAPMP
jgi:lipoprotein-anchoring transpeptidase ErfK/SrfK